MSRTCAALVAIWLVATPLPALAQDATLPASPAEQSQHKVEEAVQHTREVYGPRIRKPCGTEHTEPGEIVVCAQDPSQFRMKSTSEIDPLSHEATYDGIPRAPDFSRLPSCAVRKCHGWAPPPIYIIDLKAIPEAPEGSDADKIAKGEMAPP